MDCRTYIEQYLSAHVDGELGDAELRAAEEHLAGCADCRARFAEERAVKSLMRERARMLRTPAMVRGSILAALDATDSLERRERAAGADRVERAMLRRARLWIPVSLAAAAVLVFVILHGGGLITPAHAITPFDVAVGHYARFVAHFEPTVASNAPPDISAAYMDHHLPGLLWNLQPSGYKLVGGRIEHLHDGSPAAFTFYRSDTGAILCTYMKAPGFEPPPGAIHANGVHNYYVYKGYSICLSYPRNGFICILVSGRPMNQFLEDIAASEM